MKLQFYVAPFSRATSIHWLLEEFGLAYEPKVMDIRGKTPEDYRKIQAHKKVPALVDGDIIVTERAAITLYLCEKYPSKNFAPAIGDPKRAVFLSRLIYSDSVIDPSIAAHFLKFDYRPSDVSYGGFDDMIAYVEGVLSEHDYALSDDFSALDTQWASALYWGLDLLKVLPRKKILLDYVERCKARPAFERMMAAEQNWLPLTTPPKAPSDSLTM